MSLDLLIDNPAEIINKLVFIADKAGYAVMDIYKNGSTELKKEDASPVTEADIASHDIIISMLKDNWPEIYILSEEDYKKKGSMRNTILYWAVDPLDGTKEFINKSNQFTINIALIKNGQPIIGLIYAPALDLLFTGCTIKAKECKKRCGGKWTRLKRLPIKTTISKNKTLKILVSRSHPSKKLTTWLSSLNKKFLKIEMGSSLKFCMLAEGKADYYPRFGSTYIWDTAAGEAILESTGGSISSLKNKKLNYKSSLVNDFFIAKSSIQAFLK